MVKYPEDFNKWTTQLVEDAFGLKRTKTNAHLTEWLNCDTEVTDEEKRAGWRLQDHAQERIAYWNESDVKFKLLGPLMQIVQLDTDKFASYTEHRIQEVLTTVDGQHLKVKGKPDLMIAKGRYQAELPYFCFQEYKKQRGNPSDPLGQVLVAMLIAQKLNPEEMPVVYGSFSEGREWFFLILQGKEYAVSRTFLLIEPEGIVDVIQKMKCLKHLIGSKL
jgi:hypothetical protein